MAKTAIVLLSGGIDSATCFFLAKKKGFKVHALIFDYGQKHRREIESAKQICRKTNCKYTVCKISFPWGGSSLIDSRLKIPERSRGIPSTYVPARNIIFLSFALSYAEALRMRAIFIGANARDFSSYPDCRPDFYRIFRKAARKGLKNKEIKISTPLINKTKIQIVKLGQKLGVPFELTWSCYRGEKRPCGVCDSCRFRAKGFRGAGMKDPLVYGKSQN